MYYENFIQLCNKKGVKPGTVARETGISTATITAWKQNKYTPKQDKLQKIADYFEVSLDSLLNGNNKNADILDNQDDEQFERFKKYYSLLNSEQKTIVDNLLAALVKKQ